MDFLSPEQILRDVETVGPKARRLAEARTRGFPVPPFVVLRPNAGADAPWGADGRTRLADALQSLNAPSYAVRSCAVEEDGVASHAGRFLTRLAVAPGDVPAAVEAVWADARARGAAAGFAVMLQRQVAAERAGVVFTRHPLASPHFLIEWVEGPGAPLVGGTAAPRRASFLRGAAPADGPLSRAALRWVLAAEELFGHPQDVEWAMEKGAFFFLQSRPITALSAEAARGCNGLRPTCPRAIFFMKRTN
jgi:phosphoenolpyruvate synthase/pyruvate phosphate dikinase